MTNKWFQKAVRKGRTRNLNGWRKDLPAGERRARAYRSRVSNYSPHDKYLSAGRALIALANVTQDRETRAAARSDAEYFFRMAKKRR